MAVKCLQLLYCRSGDARHTAILLGVRLRNHARSREAIRSRFKLPFAIAERSGEVNTTEALPVHITYQQRAPNLCAD
jgi:hypothetical protein